MNQVESLANAIAALSLDEFAEVMGTALTMRKGDHTSPQLETRWVLAQVSTTLQFDAEPRERFVEFLASPSSDAALADFGQQGTCEACHHEAISVAKRAICGICGSPVSLT